MKPIKKPKLRKILATEDEYYSRSKGLFEQKHDKNHKLNRSRSISWLKNN